MYAIPYHIGQTRLPIRQQAILVTDKPTTHLRRRVCGSPPGCFALRHIAIIPMRPPPTVASWANPCISPLISTPSHTPSGHRAFSPHFLRIILNCPHHLSTSSPPTSWRNATVPPSLPPSPFVFASAFTDAATSATAAADTAHGLSVPGGCSRAYISTLPLLLVTKLSFRIGKCFLHWRVDRTHAFRRKKSALRFPISNPDHISKTNTRIWALVRCCRHSVQRNRQKPDSVCP